MHIRILKDRFQRFWDVVTCRAEGAEREYDCQGDAAESQGADGLWRAVPGCPTTIHIEGTRLPLRVEAKYPATVGS
jgi:hypothetical protein